MTEAYHRTAHTGAAGRSLPEEPFETLSEASHFLASTLADLQHKIRLNRDGQDFPELERFSRRNVALLGDARICGFCGVELDEEPRWHFEEDHYDQFLTWLEIRSFRQRRVKLVRQRKRKQLCKWL